MTRIFGRAVRAAVLAALLPCLSAPGARAADLPMPPAPPPEAVSACSGKAAQDTCQLTFGGQAEPGTCAASADGTLACRPSRPPPHGPPPEAVQACSGYTEGEACAVTLGGDTLDGVCEPGPGSGALACRPTRLPPPPGR
jgi:hypothetical protein